MWGAVIRDKETSAEKEQYNQHLNFWKVRLKEALACRKGEV
jgi:hypothetical protein